MKLWEYVNKTVRLALVDGTSVIGKVLDWYDGVDLDGDDEIVIEDHSYPESSIKQIEVIST
ncbi:4-hydroxy-3-methylbut-2-enyl diphosphate reductase [uncultured Streptococcus sp.]|uniref:4-hydroxy-3-methylbut-2-enyl diphosphate reductase n=1 Tax=uncultured Streptococcus sp. TaxID=83427 RepID=UPI0025E19B10|nr:4-hydroxy-3-methylbut-2-enyl diphosphate reductase [uncultured Streptococcus sp.]HEL2509865.1 4-hydroxy-3-methylbut-2-enyl diphosphate reductase [Streptococcus suis]HEM2578471.1 4-hydroxy-3-methylbut-2-enyl diphosphate reductase [Streptococcus suis]